MKSRADIQCRSLKPGKVEAFFEICWDETTRFGTESRSLSSIIDDELPTDIDLRSYLQDYFTGKRLKTPVKITMADIEHLPAVQIIDLLYRDDVLTPYEDWVISQINQFINSRRVFAIACNVGFSKVIDCFLEMHSREWFGPLASLFPQNIDKNFVQDPFMISEDGSAKKLGDNFFIHSGTNHWNRTWLPTTKWDWRWDKNFYHWQSLMTRSQLIAKKLSAKKFQFLFIPEKDTLARTANPGVIQSGFLPIIFMQKLAETAPTGSVLFPVTQLLNTHYADVRFQSGDSHLSANDYWIIFQLILGRFGLEKHSNLWVNYDFTPNTGDLGSKFNITDGRRQTLRFDLAGPQIIKGQTELQTPLRNNYVCFSNPAAPIKKSLLIFGDSHSSTGVNPFLTYIASHFFSHVEFCWNPFDIHHMDLRKLKRSRYTYILFETSQRFATPTVE